MDGSTMSNNNMFPQSNSARVDDATPASAAGQASTDQTGTTPASIGQGDNNMAGYPLLLQQFFLQQQAEAAQQQLQYGSPANLGLFANQMGIAPQWTNHGASAGDLSTTDRNSMLLQGGSANAAFMGLQQQQQSQPHQGAQGNTNNDTYAEQGILGPWSARSAGLLGKMVCTDPAGAPSSGKVKRTRRKQPKDKPKRPLR